MAQTSPLSPPLAFLQQVRLLLGEQEAEALVQALTTTQPPVSIRLNPVKRPAALPAEVTARVPWSTEGVYLSERPKFTYDPLLHAGTYYVQEASSMAIEQAYRTIAADFEPHRLLDLCAAPGGKSTLWRSLLPDGALLVANEPIRNRAQILAENLTKWGHPNVVCTSAYADGFAPLGSFFDVIATDVPCSGEGMFRKDAGAVAEWSPEAVMACAARQWEIISTIWPALRQGGYLVYSTCTYNQEENEQLVSRICAELGAELIPIPSLSSEWGIAGDTTGADLPVYHFFPHHVQGEGLFLALLRKTSEAPVLKEKKVKKQRRTEAHAVKGAAEMAGWLANHEEMKLLSLKEGTISAVRQSLAKDVQMLSAALPTLTAGILLAEERGHKRIPAHALALSTSLAPNAFPRVELSLETALSYLRHEALILPSETPRGYVIATFKDQPLGFLNNLGSRANNLYPQEWRIRN